MEVDKKKIDSRKLLTKLKESLESNKYGRMEKARIMH